jgi:hypothetical protein
MKKLAFTLLLFLPAGTALAFGAKRSTNPADYPLTIHVVFSHYHIDDDPQNGGYQLLDAVLDGQKIELRGGSHLGVLNLGDYKAQRVTTYAELADGVRSFIPKHASASDNFIVYLFLMPDNSVREYYLIGLGPKATSTTNP